MFDLAKHIAILTVLVFGLAKFVPGMRVKGIKSAFTVALTYSLVNVVAFKLLIWITFPAVILKWLTLGLFGIVINAVLLKITDAFLDDFSLANFSSALLAGAGITIGNLVLGALF